VESHIGKKGRTGVTKKAAGEHRGKKARKGVGKKARKGVVKKAAGEA
jgi:hypothetical protein